MAATASSFGTTWCLRRAAQAFAISHSHILRNNVKLSLQRNFCSHLLSVSTSLASGVSQTVQALKGEVDLLLKGVGERSVTKEVKHILEMARRASLKREILHTDFLTPPVLKESMQVLEKLADVKAIAQGGYPQAERCRISVGHPEELTSDPDIISALSITGNFQFEPCSHGDFLGSILGTGIVREKLGDIILQGEQGAQIIVVPELVEFLMSTLVKVRNVPVSCTKIPLISLDYEPPRTKSFKTIEASLRVDALASAGFKVSRSKLVDMIRLEISNLCLSFLFICKLLIVTLQL
ncbi:putative RNA-binding protein YlmH isoform C [Glycine soja]|uniref:Putative RNA-binding protein YlmH isoform C n=1 Tax=Glycine soja TaxID=3848 RepID=A0A445HTX5_GLYSO|nr:putative RNA-binding protein YlmH isoform C [Glycine soja]